MTFWDLVAAHPWLSIVSFALVLIIVESVGHAFAQAWVTIHRIRP